MTTPTEDVNKQFWYRILFKLKLYEQYGDSYQQLVNQILSYTFDDFQSISPWGNLGDGGNDGWRPNEAEYYQVYAPKPTTVWQPKDAVDKAIADFDKLRQQWPTTRRYFFLLNDRYIGIPSPVAQALAKLKKDHSLDNAAAIGCGTLENYFMRLSDDQKQMIVGGGIPAVVPNFIDQRALGELLTYIANKEIGLPNMIIDDLPEFAEKIQFNGLNSPVSDYLRINSYHVTNIDEYLDARDPSLQQTIADEIKDLYKKSKIAIPDSDQEASNTRYIWMIESLVPQQIRSSIYAVKAHREAAQILLSKYFETCDAYENPLGTITA